jgi:hypothetical protein
MERAKAFRCHPQWHIGCAQTVTYASTFLEFRSSPAETTQRFVRFTSLLRCGAERCFLFRPELSDHHDNAHDKSNHAKEVKIAECIVEHDRVRHAGRFDHRISPGVYVAPKTAVDYSV